MRSRGGDLDEDSHEILEEVQSGGEVQAEVCQAGAQRLQQLLRHRHIPPAAPHNCLSSYGQVGCDTLETGRFFKQVTHRDVF